jgi:hypothetical protein
VWPICPSQLGIYAKAVARTAEIHVASAFGNLMAHILATGREKLKKIRVLTSQVITPAPAMDAQPMSSDNNIDELLHSLQPLFMAVSRQLASALGDMYPLPASPWRAGFPMTILLRETPFALISNTEEPGYAPPDFVSRLVHDVYIELPSEQNRIRNI